MKKIILLLQLTLFLFSAQAFAKAPSGAVILAYTRIGEDAYPDESLRREQFADQINLLIEGEYHILPVNEIVSTIKNGKELPDKTVGITFDGAFRSAYEQAMPLLLEKQIPFTVFFASDLADTDPTQYIGWQDLKALRRYTFVSFGLHPALYARMDDFSQVENQSNINKALKETFEKLGERPDLFAFPFGEYTSQHMALLENYNFSATFGLQSGAFNKIENGIALPRFAMTERYGNAERFRLITSALPFDYSDLEPSPPVFDNDQPVMGFSVSAEQAAILDKTTCFVSGQGRAKLMRIGDSRIEIRTPSPVDDDRLRINCTAPAPKVKEFDEQRWYWIGLLLHRKDSPTDPSEDENIETPVETDDDIAD